MKVRTEAATLRARRSCALRWVAKGSIPRATPTSGRPLTGPRRPPQWRETPSDADRLDVRRNPYVRLLSRLARPHRRAGSAARHRSVLRAPQRGLAARRRRLERAVDGGRRGLRAG